MILQFDDLGAMQGLGMDAMTHAGSTGHQTGLSLLFDMRLEGAGEGTPAGSAFLFCSDCGWQSEPIRLVPYAPTVEVLGADDD